MRGVGLWQTDPAPWTGADAADPLLVLPNGSRYDFKPQLYNLDGIACASASLRHSLRSILVCTLAFGSNLLEVTMTMAALG